MPQYTDGEIFQAVSKAFHMAKKRPIPLAACATVFGMAEQDVASALIRHSFDGRAVSFRFPPLPEAAITNVRDPSLSLTA